MKVIDTHCHLDLVQRKGVDPLEALQRAGEKGVTAVIQIATGLDSSRRNRELAERVAESDRELPRLYWTAGMHPEEAHNMEQLVALLSFIRENRDHPAFVAVGEVGLDYFHSMEFVENQRTALRKLLDLATDLALPVVIHMRDDRAYNPDKLDSVRHVYEMVRERKGLKGVLHCYTYGYEEAMPFVELGWMVSYSGIVTYKNAEVVQEGASRLPLECLMVETDAPFLTPMPERGKLNEPCHVPLTLDFLAALRARNRGEDEKTVKRTILENSEKFIRWKDHA